MYQKTHRGPFDIPSTFASMKTVQCGTRRLPHYKARKPALTTGPNRGPTSDNKDFVVGLRGPGDFLDRAQIWPQHEKNFKTSLKIETLHWTNLTRHFTCIRLYVAP